MRITGTGGEVRCGGRLAAALARWTYEGKRDDWTVTAAASSTDPYWLSQGTDGGVPFRLLLHLNRDGSRRMRWNGVTVSPAGPDSNELTIAGQGAPEYA